MNKRKSLLISFISLILIAGWSCSNRESTTDKKPAENRILQGKDGSISLVFDKAACYTDAKNPSNNTADWNIVISEPGRFKVWLSSSTKDTSRLNFPSSVRISLLDNQLEVNPSSNKVVRYSKDVQYPNFRADSYMGSIYVSEPGEYNIQLISEKVIAKNGESHSYSSSDDTKLMSVILTPEKKF